MFLIGRKQITKNLKNLTYKSTEKAIKKNQVWTKVYKNKHLKNFDKSTININKLFICSA